jgi:hypothetical protein
VLPCNSQANLADAAFDVDRQRDGRRAIGVVDVGFAVMSTAHLPPTTQQRYGDQYNRSAQVA